MKLYDLALFAHLMGLVSLFGGFVLMQRAGSKLRVSATWEEVRQWMSLLRQVRGMTLGGTLMLLAGGVYMTIQSWDFGAPWIVVGSTIIVLFPLLGGLVIGKGMERLGKRAGGSSGPIAAADRIALADPSVWATALGIHMASLGMVWVMTSKPGWAMSVGLPLGMGIVGAVIGARKARAQATAEPKAAR
jgi:hypothetical protein